MRFVRTFDANGRVIEENQERKNPGLMFAERFSSEDRARIDDKEMEALNKAATTMLSGLRGTGTTYTYDSRGRMIESRERNFVFEKITTILYNAQGDRAEERTTITGNSVIPVGVEYSIDENDTFVPSQPEVEGLAPAGVPTRIPKFSTAINTTATTTGWSEPRIMASWTSHSTLIDVSSLTIRTLEVA